jgi:hypothetical protein
MEGGSRTRRDGNEDGANKVCGGGCGERAGPWGRGAVQWGSDIRHSMRVSSCEPWRLQVCGAQQVCRQTGGRSAPCRISGTIHGCTACEHNLRSVPRTNHRRDVRPAQSLRLSKFLVFFFFTSTLPRPSLLCSARVRGR